MARIDDKFAALAWTQPTMWSFDQVVAAARDAAHRSAGMATKLREEGINPGQFIVFKVKRLVLDVGTVAVSFVPGNGGYNQVRFEIRDYLTSQSTFLFIPIMPKDSPAFPTVRTFSNLMGRHVSGVQV